MAMIGRLLSILLQNQNAITGSQSTILRIDSHCNFYLFYADDSPGNSR